MSHELVKLINTTTEINMMLTYLPVLNPHSYLWTFRHIASSLTELFAPQSQTFFPVDGSLQYS